jgi:F-box protein 18 (helicase)
MSQSTEEQAKVIEAINNTQDNLLIKALAGTGKTSTLLAAISPNIQKHTQTLLCAFAKANEQDFRKKLGFEPKGATVPAIKTINALGHGMLREVTGKFVNINAYKLHDLAKVIRPEWANRDDEWQLTDMIDEVSQAKLSALVPTHPLAKRGNYAENQMTEDGLALLKLSIKEAFAGNCDFDDQIYMPAIFGHKSMFERQGFQTIIVDEAQDFSELNIMFIHLLNPPRLIVIGDPLQSIYGFRGAKVGAMENLMTGREYQTLNLTKSFRVPHVLSARQTAHAPGFHSHESCPDGTLTKWEKWKLSDIKDGDTVLCRNNAPLFSLCFALIASGRGASIVGKDVSKSLGALLKRVCGKYPSVEKLQAYAKKEREEKPQRAGVTQDKVDCLIAFLSGFDGTTAEAQEKIKQMFLQGQPITLSSGHRAKGLEWPRVIHLDPWRINKSIEKLDPQTDAEEIQQEKNIRYVIETRAKQTLILANSSALDG